MAIDVRDIPAAPTPGVAPAVTALGGPNPVLALPPDATRLQKILHELKPTTLTGGWPISPLMVLLLITAVEQVDQSLVGVLGPEIKDYFGLDLTAVGGLLALSSLLGLFVALPIGYLVDRLPRTKLAAGGAAVLGLFCIFTGLAPTVIMLGFARFGASLGRTMDSAHFSLLSDYYPPETRASVFASRQMAQYVGQILGPLVAGLIAAWLFWQAAFFILAIPAIGAAVYMWTRMPEPVRGAHERRAMGASEEVALMAERPPSLGEALRVTWGVRSLRRIFWALPFLVGSAASIGTLISFYYTERFDLGPSQRGFLLALNQPAAILGVVVGGMISARLLRFRPGRVITYAGAMASLTGFGYLLAALSPLLWLNVAFFVVSAFAGAILGPSLNALISLVTPARARGTGLSLAVVFVVPGIIFQFFALGLGDRWGIQAAILFMVPVYWLGSIILGSAGGGVEADIRAATAAAMAAQITRDSKIEGKPKLLVCKDVDVHYGSVQILFNVDFEVEEGEMIALLGTNGAGKSTLLRAISGLTPPSNGAIFFDGEDITHLPAAEHASRGIIQVPGGRGIFPGLTVAENLRLAAWMFRSDEEYVKAATDKVYEYFPVLRERSGEVAGNLSGGQQQMLTLGQAFLSRPRLLMIDELSLGLAPVIVAQLLEIVRGIAAQGTTIILVEQSVNVALTVARRAVFMEKGEVRFSGPTAELMQRPDILRSVYLKGSGAGGGIGSGGGGAPKRARSATGEMEGDVVLELRGIRKSFGGVKAINGVDFKVYDGQILGLIGPNGAGKTTIFDIISGFTEPDEGEVLLLGEDVTLLTPDQRAKLGLQRSFQDARLFPNLTVLENICVALERHIEAKNTTMAALHLPNVRKSEAKIKKRSERLITMLNLKDFQDKFVRELSTGSRRIVDLACCMAAEPKVLLLDEPSSGIAQKEAEELGPLLQRIKYETGCTLLVIEHDMPLLMSISDELLALELGAPVTRGRPEDVVEDERVVASYLGTSEEVIQRSGNA